MSDDIKMTTSRPYLIRAIYEWIIDNEMTPYILVDTSVEGVVVPKEFIQDGKIILNINQGATDKLLMDNRAVSFSARFDGRPMAVNLPVSAVLAVYARENGQGMMFPEGENETITPEPPEPTKPTLSVVK